jgi:molybdopterin synthase sulfur carrier subunit
MTQASDVQVLIPTPLRKYTDGSAKISGAGGTVAAVLDSIDQQHPGLKDRICEDDGEIRRFVNVFVNGENVRDLDGLSTSVKAGDEIGIIPAMAGGA